jgi:hypothetical protein
MLEDSDTGLREPTITIEGEVLTFAEAMTLRVAIGMFCIQLADPDFRRGLGEVLAGHYARHAHAIEHLCIWHRRP